MMSTMSFVAHSHPGSCGTKARANSHDYYFVDGSSSTNNNNADDGNNNTNGDSSASQGSGSFHYDAYSLQRAMSSEARLPSREEQREQATHGGGGTNNEEEEGDDDDDDDLQYCPSDGDGLTLSSSNETDEVLHDLGASQQRNRIQESDSHRITPSPTRGKRRPTHLLQRHRQPMRPTSPFGLISRSVSDTTHTTGSAAKRILLQTIESRGDDTTTAAAVATANMTPKPPPPRRSSGINNSRAISTTNNNTTSPNHNSMHHPPPHHQPQHSNASSFVSHYSIDAGKHGFLSHSPPPSPPPRLHSFSNGDDDSTADGGAGIIGDANSVVSNGSLVFKYLPGQETPPAEYALPVSILKVYGDSLVDEMIDHPHHLIHGNDDEDGGVPGSSSGSGQGARDDNDDIDIPPSSARRKTFVDESLSKEKEGQRRRREEESTATARTSSRWSELPLPPQTTILEGGTATAAASGTGPSLPEQQQQVQQRILPYHERKRLSEQLMLEKEKQRRQKKNGANTTNAKNSQQRTNSKVNGGMVFGASENTPLNDGMRSDRGYYGDTTATITSPLLASNPNNTTTNDDYDVKHHGHDAVAHHVIPPKDTKEWFGRLVSIITGKTAFEDDDGDDREEHRKQRGGGKRDQDPKQTYRDQAEAFLKKTEIERMKISARQKNLDRSWAKRSSISAALDSIPSCSGEEEEEEEVETGNNDHVDNDTNETYSSSEEEDEEYGSYYFDNQKGGGVGATPSSTMAGSGANTTPKVWKYGEPPTTTMDHNSAPMKKHATSKKHRMSEHDLIMRRDRLLQEEYEYRLRALQREHANLSKKFRIFVLVTVAIIFSGALTFAFVVCVRMLMSL